MQDMEANASLKRTLKIYGICTLRYTQDLVFITYHTKYYYAVPQNCNLGSFQRLIPSRTTMSWFTSTITTLPHHWLQYNGTN